MIYGSSCADQLGSNENCFTFFQYQHQFSPRLIWQYLRVLAHWKYMPKKCLKVFFITSHFDLSHSWFVYSIVNLKRQGWGEICIICMSWDRVGVCGISWVIVWQRKGSDASLLTGLKGIRDQGQLAKNVGSMNTANIFFQTGSRPDRQWIAVKKPKINRQFWYLTACFLHLLPLSNLNDLWKNR